MLPTWNRVRPSLTHRCGLTLPTGLDAHTYAASETTPSTETRSRRGNHPNHPCKPTSISHTSDLESHRTCQLNLRKSNAFTSVSSISLVLLRCRRVKGPQSLGGKHVGHIRWEDQPQTTEHGLAIGGHHVEGDSYLGMIQMKRRVIGSLWPMLRKPEKASFNP